jgi:hypothetical protein
MHRAIINLIAGSNPAVALLFITSVINTIRNYEVDMKFADIATENLFEDEDLKQLEESVANPNWSEPMDVNDFITRIRQDADAS